MMFLDIKTLSTLNGQRNIRWRAEERSNLHPSNTQTNIEAECANRPRLLGCLAPLLRHFLVHCPPCKNHVYLEMMSCTRLGPCLAAFSLLDAVAL